MQTCLDFGADQTSPVMDPDNISYADFLTSMMESAAAELDSMGSDWFDKFLDDPVLNDRMMTDALQPAPPIANEHSYSLANSASDMDAIKHEPLDNEFDKELMKTTKTLNLTIHKQNQAAAAQQQQQQQSDAALTYIKQEPEEEISTSAEQIQTVTVTTTRPGQTILRQPTIILATTPGSTPGTVTTATIKHADRLVLPKVRLKLEPQDRAASPDDLSGYDGSLPPTPPSSNSSSDSEGGMSPQRSAPNSPIRHSHSASLASHRHNPLRSTHLHHHSAASIPAAASLFSSPIPTSGPLLLSEEEKRTLQSEGYPIPTKLPLTKQEEKNLKKVRRKIKNKISAQESRRKKKEYLETLEKKVEAYNQENVDLKRKMETLETNNRSLLSQLQKLQSLVGKVTPCVNTTPATNTCLMVMVLCFAVFLGSCSSGFASLGYSTLGGVVAPQTVSSPVGKVPMGPLIGPKVEDATVDAYSTPNMRSRVLLSMMEDDDAEFGPPTPLSYRDIFLRFFCSSDEEATSSGGDDAPQQMEPLVPSSEVAAGAVTAPREGEEEPEPSVASVNDTAEKVQFAQAAPSHPDLLADVRTNVPIENRHMHATTA